MAVVIAPPVFLRKELLMSTVKRGRGGFALSAALSLALAFSGSTAFADTPDSTNTPAAEAAAAPVSEAPQVTTHPADATATVGQTVTFTAAASGTPEPTVTWEVSTDGSTWNESPGKNTTTIDVTPASMTDNGIQYRAVFTNSEGTAATNPATLTVLSATITPGWFVEEGKWFYPHRRRH